MFYCHAGCDQNTVYKEARKICAEILNVNVSQATKLGANAPIKSIVRMASVAGLIRGNSVVLEVGRRHILRIVDIKTLPVRLHDVARETK